MLISVQGESHVLFVRVAEKYPTLTGQYGYLSRPKRLFEVREVYYTSSEQADYPDDAVRVSKHD